MTTLATLLKQNIEHSSAELWRTSPLAALVRSGNMPLVSLAGYLESLRYLLEHSQKNLARAARRSRELALDDIAEYFEHKVEEERGHDRWALDDLAHLPEHVRRSVRPARNIVALVELQGQLIERHPICFVAYALWAEYSTVLAGAVWLPALGRAQISRDRVSAFAKHVEADREHAAHGLLEIEGLWTGEPEAEVIVTCVRDASLLFARFVDELYDLAALSA